MAPLANLEIRSATAADAARLAALLAELGYPVLPTELPVRFERFTASGCVLVALREDDVCALAAVEITHPLHRHAPVAHLSAFVVARSARRLGIGRQLLLAVEQVSREAGCCEAVVTSAEHRSDAHAFYASAGWSLTGRRFGRHFVSRPLP